MLELHPRVAPRTELRETVIETAARLLHDHGAAAVTPRGVAQAAGVQAPPIYRLFGDKDGLLDAVAEHVLAAHVAAKSAAAESAAAADVDPIADLRRGWDTQIEFGLANPDLFSLLNDPARQTRSPALSTGIALLRSRIHRIAQAGRLRVSEQRAADLIHAAGSGAVLALLTAPPAERDLHLAGEMYEAITRTILTQTPAITPGDAFAAAVTFRTQVTRLPGLSDAERTLMAEWLDRAVADQTLREQ